MERAGSSGRARREGRPPGPHPPAGAGGPVSPAPPAGAPPPPLDSASGLPATAALRLPTHSVSGGGTSEWGGHGRMDRHGHPHTAELPEGMGTRPRSAQVHADWTQPGLAHGGPGTPGRAPGCAEHTPNMARPGSLPQWPTSLCRQGLKTGSPPHRQQVFTCAHVFTAGLRASERSSSVSIR